MKERSLAVRTILVLLVLAGALYIAVVAAVIALRVLPTTNALQTHSEAVLREHDAIRGRLDALGTTIGELRRRLLSTAPGDSVPVAVAERLSEPVRARLDSITGIETSARLVGVPAEMRIELAAAAGAEQAAGASVIEAISALEVDRREMAITRLVAADSLRMSTRRHLDEAQRLALVDVIAREAAVVQTARGTYRMLGTWALVGALLMAIGALVVHRRLYRPLAQLEAALSRVASGDLAARVPVARDDEMGRLGDHFNRMTSVLRERAAEERQHRADLTASFGEILEDSEGEILLFEDRTLAFARTTRGARRALGYTGEELRERTPLDIWPSFERSELEAALVPLRTGEAPTIRFTTRQTRRDGSTYPVEVAIHLSSVAQPPVFVAFVQDLTGRELSDRLREFVLEKGRVIGGGDLKRALGEICVAAADMLGVDRASVWSVDGDRIRCIELYERTADRHSSGFEIAAEHSPAYFEALAEGRPIDAAHALRDARTRDLASNYLDPAGIVSMLDVPVRVGGTLVGVICHECVGEERRWTTEEKTCAASLADLVAIAFEASERMRTQEALGTSEARYRAAFEQAGVGMAELTLDGRIMRTNEAFRRLLGRTDDELTGASAIDLTHPDDRREEEEARRGVVAGDLPLVQREKRWMTPGGATVWTSVTTAPVLSADGSADHIIMVVENITERRSLQTQLTHVQKMESIGRLAGGVAHDFNNLLTAILGYVDLAREAARRDPAMASDLEEIERAARRGADLTRQLLTFARRQVVEPAPVDVNELVKGVSRLVRPLLGERVEMKLDLQPGIGAVMADQGQLENVLINLVVNARDAMEDGGSLRIATTELMMDAHWSERHPGMAPGRHVCIAVVDDGIGMDAPTMSRIFEPFFTTKEAGKGTGLGLAMCYGIIRQAGGDIEATSEPGRGTTMRIFLPVAGRPAPAAAEPRRSISAPSGAGRVVLLVDDEPQIRSLMSRAFVRLGFDVLEAGSAEEGQVIAEQRAAPLDLLVTDMVLPGRGGRDLAAELTRRQPGLPVLFVSGYTESQFEHEALLAEGMAFLPKPFTVTELAERVVELLDDARRASSS